MAERSSHQARHPQSLKSKTAVQLRQEILQAAASHRERLLSAQGLPAHRYALRQAGAKLSRLRLSGCRYRLVDLMSLDPNKRYLFKNDPGFSFYGRSLAEPALIPSDRFQDGGPFHGTQIDDESRIA